MDRNPFQTYVTIYKDGQARKSLWIETGKLIGTDACSTGQARKSLWIETAMNAGKRSGARVRLVRACGSKLSRQDGFRYPLRSGS